MGSFQVATEALTAASAIVAQTSHDVNESHNGLLGSSSALAGTPAEPVFVMFVGAADGGVERTGADVLSDEGAQLYSALEDSLVLSRSADEERRALPLGAAELLSRMLSAGEGIWGDDWDDTREQMRTIIDRVAGGPIDLPDGAVHRPSRLGLRLRPRRNQQLAQLLDLAGQTYTAVAVFYKELAPDGRALSDGEQVAARSQIEDAAATDRELDLARGGFPERDWEPIRLMLGELRSLRRSLVLALSQDPERRALAITIPEAGVRTFVMNQRVSGASHEEAIARLPSAALGGDAGEH
jgi:hypothetical protein